MGSNHGLAFPALIHNRDYHYAEISVYSDGLIDCWGCVDLALFKQKLDQGWVMAQAPVGGTVSIYGLGKAKIGDSSWKGTSTTLLEHAEQIIETLNPNRISIVDENLRNITHGFRFYNNVWNDGFSDSRPYLVGTDQSRVPGDRMAVFLRLGSEMHLTNWFVYADGLSRVGSESALVPLEEVTKRFDGGDLVTSVPERTWITLEGLGRFQVQDAKWGVTTAGRIREGIDKLKKLRGEQDSIDICMKRFVDYQKEPSAAAVEALRKAYESVPEHLRRFCGDMGTQDYPIQKILYRERS